MGTVSFKLSKASWTLTDLSSVVSSVLTALSARGFTDASVNFENKSRVTFVATKDTFDYAAFGTLKGQLDSFATSGAITVELLDFMV